MSLTNDIRDAIRLTRPSQWPVLSGQFFVGVLLVSPAATGGGCWLNPGSLLVLLTAWIAWVVMLNGGTLAFNSAYDRDEGPVAYLEDPPLPPSWLAVASLVFMAMGTVFGGLIVGLAFGLVIGVCVVLSVLYSHPAVRLKAIPGVDLLVNVVGYGIGTTVAGVLAGLAAQAGSCTVDAWQSWTALAGPWPASNGPWMEQMTAAGASGMGWIALGFGLLFGSFYPLTQLYQMTEDQQRGDRTLATALGHRSALALAIGLGLGGAGLFGLGLMEHRQAFTLVMVLPLAALLSWLFHLVNWWRRAKSFSDADHKKGMYRALTLWAVVDGTLLMAWIVQI